ncbi:MAG TPA: Imm1 family immunity protein [Mycobacteriales bacterium]|nr:Imm1 family immunity protein [Mycobacteriales bacterium]
MVGRWYDHDRPFLLHTEAELDHMIDRMRHAPPHHDQSFLWVFDRFDNGWPNPPGASMDIGLADDQGCLSFGSRHAGSHYPPGLWYSLGDPDAPTEDVVYLAGDGDSEYFYPRSAVIGLDDIRAAMHEFARTGERPTAVRWQDWRPPLIESAPPGEDYDPADDPWAAIPT